MGEDPHPARRAPSRPPHGGEGDWRARLRLAAERFGIGPEAFWRLSLVEWRALTETRAPAALGRGELERLLIEHAD